MKTCKRTSDHNIWEIWNEWSSESVYFIGKPTKSQIQEVTLKEWGKSIKWTLGSVDDYIRKNVHVNKLPDVYCSVS